MCHGQNNGIFKIELISKTTARNLSPILGEDFFFFGDHPVLGTKCNKDGVKVPRFLMNFKNVPQSEKGSEIMISMFDFL